MADATRPKGRLTKAVYAVLAFISVVLAIVKFASFAGATLSAAQPAPLLTDHYEISGHVATTDAPGAPLGSHAN